MTELKEKLKQEFEYIGDEKISGHTALRVINNVLDEFSTLQLDRGKELPSENDFGEDYYNFKLGDTCFFSNEWSDNVKDWVEATYIDNIGGDAPYVAGGHTWKFIRPLIKRLSLLPNSKETKISSNDLEDLKLIRDYFGENDKTAFQHMAFAVIDRLIKQNILSVPNREIETPKGITENELLKVESVLEENKRLKSELKAIRDTEKPILEKLTSLTKQLEEANKSNENLMQRCAERDIIIGELKSTINTNSNG